MKQTWHDLLFAHWPLSPDQLRPLVPHELPLDTFDNQCWVGVVPFRMSGIRAHWLPPVPGLSSLPELNVRTYVTYKGKPGVYFFSLDAGNLSAVWGARVFYRLPYWHADMKVTGKDSPLIDYRSRRIHGPKPAEFVASYGPTGPVRVANPGSLDSFLTDRYCLYAWNRKKLYRCEVHHLPWPLQEAQAAVKSNSMASIAGIPISED